MPEKGLAAGSDFAKALLHAAGNDLRLDEICEGL